MKGERPIRDQRDQKDAIRRITWMLNREPSPSLERPSQTEPLLPSYGDLTSLNDTRLILDSVGTSFLSDIAEDIMDLLDTSCAVYERNGDYAAGPFSSCWCRFMDHASRALCRTPDNQEAMGSGKWHCHESCRNEAALRTIETNESVDMACRGGVRLFATPIWAGKEVVGCISLSYGDPPRDQVRIDELATLYGVDVQDLRRQAEACELRPPFLVGLAKKRILSAARLIGEMVTRKAIEQTLHHSEEKFRTLFAFVEDAILICDRDGRLFEVNGEACESLGYTRDELLKMTCVDIVAPESSALFEEQIKTLRRQDHHRFETVLRRCDGSLFPVEVAVRSFRSDGRKLFLAVCRDIAERKDAETALKRSEEKYRSLVETTSDWVWEIDTAGAFTYSSPRVEDLLGYKPEEVLGKSTFDFMPPPERERVTPIFQETLESKSPVNALEHINTHKNGQIVYLETNAIPIADDEGNLVGYRGTDRNITKRKLAELALAESEQRFSVLMRYVPAAVFIKDQLGRFVFVNRYMEEVLGWQGCIGKTSKQIQPFELAEQRMLHDRKALEGGLTVLQEKMYDASGAEHSFDVYKFPIRMDDSTTLVGGIAVDITNRINMERELANTKILLQSAFAQTPVPMILVSSPEGIIINVNPALAEILGVEDRDHPVGRYLSEIDQSWQDLDREGNPIPHHEVPIALALEGITTKNKEMIVQRKDGTRRHEIVSAAPIHNDEGKMIAAFAVFPDITELKQAEEALEKRVVALTAPMENIESIAFEDMFNLSDLQCLQDLLAESWGVAALITRPDGTPITRPSNFSHFCSNFVRKTERGLKNCQLSHATLGRPNPSGPTIERCLNAGLWTAGVSITLDGRHIASWLVGQVRNGMQSEEQIIEYARLIAADEGAFRDAFLKVPVMTQERFEQIAHALFAIANQLATVAYQNIQQAQFIAERKRAEEALLESEARFRRMVEFSPLAIGFANQDSAIDYVNPKFTEKFGYTIRDIPTLRDWFRLAFPDPAYRQYIVDRWQAIWEIHPQGSGANTVIEVEFTCKDGSVKTVEIHRSRMGTKTFEIFNDLTERKRMENERSRFEIHVREIQKLESLGVLAGGIAHDFNNLLMTILGNADLALLRLPAVSPVRRHIEEITRASHQAADLCRQMLAYSGKGHFLVDRNDLSKIVREMGQILGVSVSKKATIRYSLAQDLPLVESDTAQIRQIIMNLVTNASDALDDRGGIITVATGVMECAEDYLSESLLDDDLPGGVYVHLDVSDTGHGMDLETQSKIFDPFFTTKFIGRGLGLAAVLGIVRGHKGAIKVTSNRGEGTTMRVLLPASEGELPRMVKGEAEAPGSYQKGTILVVDDDASVLNVVTQMLTEVGFHVLTARNGREGIKIFRVRASEIGCVILDLLMPEMGGEEAFVELRGLRSDVKVILSSGYDESEVTQRFAGEGTAGFIQKPYTIEKLQKALNSVLGEAQS